MSLSSFLGFSRQFVELHYHKTKESLYLHIKRTRKVCDSLLLLILQAVSIHTRNKYTQNEINAVEVK